MSAACATACTTYQPGSFRAPSGPFPGERHTVGCLDIAVAPAPDPAAEGPVAQIWLGNRCDAAVEVDLGAIAARGRRADGSVVPMRVYDPDRAIRAAALEARASTREVLEYHPAERAAHGGGAGRGSGADAIASLCLDLSRVDAAAPGVTPVVACFATEPEGEP